MPAHIGDSILHTLQNEYKATYSTRQAIGIVEALWNRCKPVINRWIGRIVMCVTFNGGVARLQ